MLDAFHQKHYAFLRSVDLQLPNLTTFIGHHLPRGYFRKILSSAPQLQKITMHDSRNTPIELTMGDPEPTSIIRHSNLKDSWLTAAYSMCYSGQMLQNLRLTGLLSLRLEFNISDPDVLLPVLAQTQGSVLSLYLGKPSALFGHQRTVYSLCPHLEELTLCYARAEDLKSLAISPDSRLCPALSRLSLPDFTLNDDADAQILHEGVTSRGLVAFDPSVFCSNCRQLKSVGVSVVDKESLSVFQRYFLETNDRTLRTIANFREKVCLLYPRYNETYAFRFLAARMAT